MLRCHLTRIVAPETALVDKCLSTARFAHLSVPLAHNALVDEDANKGNEHDATDDHSDNRAGVTILLSVHVVGEMLIEERVGVTLVVGTLL